MTYDLKEVLSIFDTLNFSDIFFMGSDLEEKLIDILLKNNFKYNYGATKFVFYTEQMDYVIKIPYNATTSDCGIIPFCVATGYEEDEAWDYCAQEEKIYRQAEKDGFSYAFAKIEWIADIDYYPIYIQEKCYTVNNAPATIEIDINNSNTKEKVIKTCRDHHINPVNLIWTSAFYNYYGEDALIDFLHYIETKEIHDLHRHNIGFSKIDNRPVLIDYGGYYEYE